MQQEKTTQSNTEAKTIQQLQQEIFDLRMAFSDKYHQLFTSVTDEMQDLVNKIREKETALFKAIHMQNTKNMEAFGKFVFTAFNN